MPQVDAPLSRRDFLRMLATGLAAVATMSGSNANAQDTAIETLRSDLTLLLAFGILQPCNAEDVARFLQILASPRSAGGPDLAAPSTAEIMTWIQNDASKSDNLRWLVGIDGPTKGRQSLTLEGNELLNSEKSGGGILRRLRDTFRLQLLRGRRQGSAKARDWIDQLNQPVWGRMYQTSLATSALPPPKQDSAIDRWTIEVARGDGDAESIGDTNLPRFLSFNTIEQLDMARGGREPVSEFGPAELALCLGISQTRLTWMSHRQGKTQYRTFAIPKGDGKKRPIASPHVPLKVVQRFILDFILRRPETDHAGETVFKDPPLDVNVHSFRASRGPLTNATPHKGARFVATVDIEDFFGSVTSKMLSEIALRNLPDDQLGVPLTDECRSLIANLCATRAKYSEHGTFSSRRTRLPQGGPASPMLSNLVLDEIDRMMSAIAYRWGHTYSRYADDITISGPDRKLIEAMIDILETELDRNRLRMKLNSNKTRIVDRNRSQQVTGVVVNEVLHPPRSKRRHIRAAFHNAETAGRISREEYARLNGYIGYLNLFGEVSPSVKASLVNYRAVLKKVSVE